MSSRSSRPRRQAGWATALVVLAGSLPATAIIAVPTAVPAAAATVAATFVPQGPGPITSGQVENIQRSDGTAVDEVAGAVHVVVPHPTDADTLWVAGTNGGVWRTTNATAAQPTWVPLTDRQASLSMGALALDPTVATNTVLVAGHGRHSSFGRTGGAHAGLLRTTNGGGNRTRIGVTELTGENVSGVAPRGATILAASNSNTLAVGGGQGGIWRSTDTGATFSRLSGNGTSGLPNAGVFDLVSDPSNNARMYAGAQTGIFRSDDTGATWTNVTNQITGISSAPSGTNNIELSVAQVGGTNVVYAGIVNAGQVIGVWRSTDQGANWTALDTPQTNDGGTINGLQPAGSFKPGGQGGVHFSILADNVDANVVHLGGDRQPGPFPNSLGANDFTGRLFRCDASLAAGSQCASLTHNGTSNNSAPHADSRDMAFDANGDIVEGDDGGVYRRTSPRDNNGRWITLNGNLQVAEHQSCDYDNVGNIILCGNQDTGVPEQPAGGGSTWDSVSTADGGFIVVNDVAGGASSVRYSSSNRLGAGSFRRRTCTATSTCVNSAPGFNVVGQGQTIQNFEAQLPLYTPLFGNAVNGDRLVVMSATRLYESTDRLDNLTIIDTGVSPSRAVAYGGRQAGADAPGVLWYGDGTGLRMRSGGGGAGATLPAWTFGNPLDIVLHPQDWATAFVTNGGSVYRTDDAGATFTDITGTLTTKAPSAQVFSLTAVPVAGTDELALLAGTDAGVFLAQTQNLGNWAKLGSNLPNVVSFDLTYDPVDDVLLVGTLGRGSWLLPNASDAIPTSDLRITKTDAPDPVKAGEEVFYTVTVTNDGPGRAVAPVVIDDLPAEVVYLSDNGGCTYAATEHRLTCPLPDLASGASRSFTIKTLVKSDAVVAESDGTLLITNRATVGSVSVDTDPADNVAVEHTFVQDKADLRVTKVCKPDRALLAGDTGTCTVFVDNLGPSSARDVLLTDTHVSDGPFSFGAITPSQGTCDPPAQGVVRCRLGSIAAASPTEPGRATVQIEVSSTEEVDINDVAEATAATPDPNTSNNQARGSISVTAVSDLSLTQSGPSTAAAGTDGVYSLSLTNGGPSTARGVVVEQQLPAAVAVLSVTGSDGATCNAGTPGDPLRPATCSFGDVAPTAGSNTRTMTVSVRYLPDTRGVVHADARVSSATFDDDLSDNLATTATDVSGVADLSISKVDSPDPVLAGTELTYTLTVSNGGPSTAEAVVVQDTLPVGTTFVSGVDGRGATVCALVQPGSVVCELGTMQPATSRTVYLTVAVAPSVPAGTVLTNTALVSSATSDPDASDNSTTAKTTVDTAAELWLDKTGELRSGNPSPVVVYTLAVHNIEGCETDAESSPSPTCGAGGPSDALDVTVTDPLPLDPKKVVVQYVSPQCTYTKATHTVVCFTSRIPAGATAKFVVEVQVSGSVGSLTNGATLAPASPTFDPDTSNNSDAVTTVVKGGTGKK
jgi:uncharacterized repeat protein (TIGR01451 family)